MRDAIVVVTQHSGSGKANQYFLRGFNLDHGTDFAVYVFDKRIRVNVEVLNLTNNMRF